MTRATAPKTLFLLLGLFYWAGSLADLTVVPAVYEDEPWQASTGWKLATEGVFGSDMFTGFHGMERHYYGYMPLHPLLLGAVFRAAGLGLFQLRFEPVALGLLALALTYSLGRRLFGPGVGLLAVLFLLFGRLTGATPSQVSGILLVDISRIARYDMVVPVFGLAALHVTINGLKAGPAGRPGRFFVAGLLTALAGLGHVYGVFWLPPLALLLWWQRAGGRSLLALGLGFAGPWLIYLAYVLGGLPDWPGQTRDYAPRFALLEPAWYLDNLSREPRRYGPGLGSPGLSYALRPTFWAAALLVPGSLVALALRMARNGRGALAEAAVLAPAVILPALFALLIYLKLANYLVTVLPLQAVAAAWGGMALWRWARGRRGIRILLALLALAVLVEGGSRHYRLHAAAHTTTPYGDFIGRVRQYVPPGATVLGLYHYWLGFEDTTYRTWLVPLLQRDEYYWSPPIPLADNLGRLRPDVVLLDRRMAGLLERQPETGRIIRGWLSAGYSLLGVVEDETYGRMEIYGRSGAGDGR